MSDERRYRVVAIGHTGGKSVKCAPGIGWLPLARESDARDIAKFQLLYTRAEAVAQVLREDVEDAQQGRYLQNQVEEVETPAVVADAV